MHNRLLMVLFILIPFAGISQKKDKDAMKAAATITPDALKKHLYVIASKEMEGRDTPSPGLEKAATYIENTFKNLGLAAGNNGSYRQYYTLYRDSMTNAVMKVNGTTLELNKDYQPQANNYAAAMRFSELVFAGYGISDGDNRDDYKDLKVGGKLVMIADGVPADYKSTQTGFNAPASAFGKMNAAMNHGAAAVIIVYNNFPRRTMNVNSNYSVNGYRASQLPFTFTVSPDVAARIMGDEGRDLFAKLKDGSLKPKTYPAEIDLQFEKSSKTAQASNVIGVLEGTDLKDEYVFITGHYDHLGKRGDSVIYYGADDDGSGTTAVMQLAEAFAKAKKDGHGPRRTMVFMTVSGEEKGLWGSGYYNNHPIFPQEKTTVDLNIDMIGRIDATRKQGDSMNYVYVVGDDKISTDLKTISEATNNTYMKMELDYKFNDPKDPNRIYFRSDHYNFAQKGIPIIFYYDGMLGADYHRPTDTPDKIYYDLFAKRAQLVFYTAWEMANRNEMLKRDIKLEVPKGF
jgi:hypothetical protein